MKRILSWVDPKSTQFVCLGLIQAVYTFLVIWTTVAAFPPDLTVLWNLPVPKDGRIGIELICS